jgi:hypothetical protein
MHIILSIAFFSGSEYGWNVQELYIQGIDEFRLICAGSCPLSFLVKYFYLQHLSFFVQTVSCSTFRGALIV